MSIEDNKFNTFKGTFLHPFKSFLNHELDGNASSNTKNPQDAEVVSHEQDENRSSNQAGEVPDEEKVAFLRKHVEVMNIKDGSVITGLCTHLRLLWDSGSNYGSFPMALVVTGLILQVSTYCAFV